VTDPNTKKRWLHDQARGLVYLMGVAIFVVGAIATYGACHLYPRYSAVFVVFGIGLLAELASVGGIAYCLQRVLHISIHRKLGDPRAFGTLRLVARASVAVALFGTISAVGTTLFMFFMFRKELGLEWRAHIPAQVVIYAGLFFVLREYRAHAVALGARTDEDKTGVDGTG